MLFYFSSLLVAPLLISQAWAAPSGKGKDSAVSQNLLDKLYLYAQYSAAAYCSDNYASPPDKRLRCPTGNCPRVEQAGTEIVYSFSNTQFTDTSGFVAFDHTHRLIIVSFRGSESFRNYATFLNIPLVPVELCTGCFSAAGYYSAWVEVRDNILRAVEDTHGRFPDHNVVVTGHSLGGAIASIAVGFLRERGHNVDLATFGAPRIGNDALVQYIQSPTPEFGENYRVVHVGDPVGSFPTATGGWGFLHITPEYLVTSKTNDWPTVNDVKRRETDENGEGLIGTDVFEAQKAHDWYFGPIATCYVGGLSIPF